MEAAGPADRQTPAEKYPVFRALCFRIPFALVNDLSYGIICVVCSFEGILSGRDVSSFEKNVLLLQIVGWFRDTYVVW